MADQNAATPLLVTEKEAAKLIAVSPSMLVAHRFHGRPLLPFVRIGKRSIRYRMADIEEFIKRNREDGAP
jgi:hypothetical protein